MMRNTAAWRSMAAPCAELPSTPLLPTTAHEAMGRTLSPPPPVAAGPGSIVYGLSSGKLRMRLIWSLDVVVQVLNLKLQTLKPVSHLMGSWLKPGAFKLWVKLDSACTAPHLGLSLAWFCEVMNAFSTGL